MRRAVLLIGSLSSALIGLSAHAEVIWKGDFQTGNLSQWSNVQEAASNRLQVVTSPVAAGEKYALQVTVDSGDVASGGARAEVDYTGDSPVEGDNRYYHWQTYFPANFQPADYWQVFTQWHQYISDGSPPLAIMVIGNQIELGNENDVVFWSTPLQLGAWHDFIVHVTWSTSATVGGVEVWYDGQHVLPFTSTATLFPGDTIYLKQGLYRKSVINYTQTLYDWGMTIATALSDVLASSTTTPPPPPPTSTSQYSDTFSSCTATSGLGTGWTSSGSWYCAGGYARGESAAGYAEASLTLPSDVTATARVQLTSTATGSGVIVRAAGGDFYVARIVTPGSLVIDRVEGSTVKQLASASTSISALTFYKVGLTVSGTSPVQLTASINGQNVASATDSSAPLTAGTAGLYSGAAARTQFNDFAITSP